MKNLASRTGMGVVVFLATLSVGWIVFGRDGVAWLVAVLAVVASGATIWAAGQTMRSATPMTDVIRAVESESTPLVLVPAREVATRRTTR